MKIHLIWVEVMNEIDLAQIKNDEFKRGMLIALKMVAKWCGIAKNYEELKLMVNGAILCCDLNEEEGPA
jgi:hypothetical protein